MADTKKVILWIVGGCGVVVLLAAGTCVGVAYFAKNRIQAAIDKDPGGKLLGDAIKQGMAQGEKSGEGALVGGLQGMAGAGMALGVSAMSMQVIPSLPPAEQEAAKEVFKAFNEKSGRLGQDNFKQVEAMMKRWSDVVDPAMKAKSEAIEKATDPAEKMRLAADQLRVDPAVARRFVSDLKEIVGSIK